MKIKVDNPDFPVGHEFFLAGVVGSFPNGETVEVTQEQIAAYEAFHGHKFADGVKANPYLSLASAKGGE